MIRAYLDDWEWDCCGDPFRVGDTVTLQVREPRAALRTLLGALGDGLDLAESHHEVDADDAPARPVTGRVRRIVGVAVDHVEHSEPRMPRPAPLAPESPSEPSAGSEGLAWSAERSDPHIEQAYTIVSTPLDGTAREVAGVERVPAVARDGETVETPLTRAAEPIIGYLVDLDLA